MARVNSSSRSSATRSRSSGRSRDRRRRRQGSAGPRKQQRHASTGQPNVFRGFATGAFAGFAGAAGHDRQSSTRCSKLVTVAAESQQILGQTRFALETTGKSWAQYGDQIEETIAAQSKFGFDDEALLQSFSLFIRGTDSVTTALKRNAARDGHRAWPASLISRRRRRSSTRPRSASPGALRRLGIDARQERVRRRASCSLLNRKYGGAAAAASDDAATSMDRFKVSMENAQESMGNAAAADGRQPRRRARERRRRRQPARPTPPEARRHRTPRRRQVRRHHRRRPQRRRRRHCPRCQAARGSPRHHPGATRATRGKRPPAFRGPRRTKSASRRASSTACGNEAAHSSPSQQKNTWFDAAIGRREDRVQDIRSAKGQLARARPDRRSDPARRGRHVRRHPPADARGQAARCPSPATHARRADRASRNGTPP